MEKNRGISQEYLLSELKRAEKSIYSMISGKVFNSDIRKREWVNRYYGGIRGLHNEIMQNMALKLLTELDKIWQNGSLKYIFWEVKNQLHIHLYYTRPEIHDSVIGDSEMGSYLENLPDESQIEAIETAPNFNLEYEIRDAKLNYHEQQILKYKYFEDMDYEAICKKLNINKNRAAKMNTDLVNKLRLNMLTNNRLYAQTY